MNNNNNKEIEEKYSFILNNIGEALAIVTSFVEGKTYTYTTVRTYSWDRINDENKFYGPYYNMAIVRAEYENSDFCTNNNPYEIWRMQKLAFIFKNNDKDQHTSITLNNKKAYLRIFMNSNFEYLQDFIELLASERKNTGSMTRAQANALAIKFCNHFSISNNVPSKDGKSSKTLIKK